MKKFTLLAAMAVMAFGANAQNVDPVLSTVLNEGKVASVQTIILDQASVAALTLQGADIQDFGPNDVDRFLYVWEGTFVAGESNIPGVGFHTDGYTSLIVADKGWSGAGFHINKGVQGNSTMSWNENTRIHVAYASPTTACPSAYILINDQDGVNTPATMSLGASFDGAPVIGAAPNDDWQGIDLSFADVKKLCPTFDWRNTQDWTGNIFVFGAGGVQGVSIAFDAVYFYNLASNGIAAIEGDNAAWVVTENTVNLNGANGIELYDLSGKLVKSTAGSTLGINNLGAGLYIAKGANTACKVLVK